MIFENINNQTLNVEKTYSKLSVSFELTHTADGFFISNIRQA